MHKSYYMRFINVFFKGWYTYVIFIHKLKHQPDSLSLFSSHAHPTDDNLYLKYNTIYFLYLSLCGESLYNNHQPPTSHSNNQQYPLSCQPQQPDQHLHI